MTSITPPQWHARFQQQAAWTQELRQHLFEQIRLNKSARLLEVGCGTGAILSAIAAGTPQCLFGLDISLEYLSLAKQNAPGSILAGGDAHALPYASNSFDVTLCHFLLLWVRDPFAVVAEMKRVTRPGGWVLLLAEPDYGGRIDYPQVLESLGKYQAMSLRKQGADPEIGRRLAGLLAGAGLTGIQGGVLGGAWARPPSPQDWQTEWSVLRHDLSQLNQIKGINAATLDELQDIDRRAWENGERVLFVPTFYALGRKESTNRR